MYRYVGLGTWLLISALMVLDRFYWNVWPRQSICTDGCGGDFFCDMDDVSVQVIRRVVSFAKGLLYEKITIEFLVVHVASFTVNCFASNVSR